MEQGFSQCMERLDLPIDIEDTIDNERDGKSRTSKCQICQQNF